MKKEIPAWALRMAKAEDHGVVREMHSRGTLHIKWPNHKGLRDWSTLHGWPTPKFDFEAAFLAKMFECQVNFEQAINGSGIEIQLPQQAVTLSVERLDALDALYAERSPSGHPVGWGSLVGELREIRRAVEAGVVVQVEGGPKLQTWQGFYAWAHGRYHMLEDGYDSWMGDDNA